MRSGALILGVVCIVLAALNFVIAAFVPYPRLLFNVGAGAFALVSGVSSIVSWHRNF